MKRKGLYHFVLILALIMGFLPLPCLKAKEDIAIIEDIKIDLVGKTPEIKIASNIPIEYLDYTLESPSRIIIDPLGAVYCNLDDRLFSGDNLVQAVSIVKARGRIPPGLDRTYYPLDFIIIELRKPIDYDVLREEQLVVKLGGGFIPQSTRRTERVARQPRIEITEVEEPEVEIGEEFFDEEKFPLVDRYIIEPGDELEISVWRHPDLLRKVVVRPDGLISFPLTGEIDVNGLSADRLAREIALRLSRVLRKPEVSVIVASFGSKSIFILGAVNKPGLYPYETKTTALSAISSAGSWKPYAHLKSVLVVKRFFTAEAEVIRINLWDVIKKGEVDKDIALQAGDIVYVPQSFIGNLGDFLSALRIGFGTGAYFTIQ